MRKSINNLTKHELDFASSNLYPKTKNSIMLKMNVLFNDVGYNLSKSPIIKTVSRELNYKISKGENYKNMPYMVCDFPKISGPKFKLVMRTMFWWGHYFSCHFIIQTQLLQESQCVSLINSLSKIKLLNVDDLWEQEISTLNYISCKKAKPLEIKHILSQKEYLKLSIKIPINKMHQLPVIATDFFEHLTQHLIIKKGAS